MTLIADCFERADHSTDYVARQIGVPVNTLSTWVSRGFLSAYGGGLQGMPLHWTAGQLDAARRFAILTRWCGNTDRRLLARLAKRASELDCDFIVFAPGRGAAYGASIFDLPEFVRLATLNWGACIVVDFEVER